MAWLANPNTRTEAGHVPELLSRFHSTLIDLGKPVRSQASPDHERYVPAVTVRKSLSNPDRILSMIDGKPYASLKRHLAANGLTPEEYRSRYNLKADYPIVAPGYSRRRSEHARQSGLGRKAGEAVQQAVGKVADAALEAAGAAVAPGRKKLRTKF